MIDVVIGACIHTMGFSLSLFTILYTTFSVANKQLKIHDKKIEDFRKSRYSLYDENTISSYWGQLGKLYYDRDENWHHGGYKLALDCFAKAIDSSTKVADSDSMTREWRRIW